MKDYSLAATAYLAYCRASGGRSLISGASLPAFDGLRPIIKDAWWEAAREVEREVAHAVTLKVEAAIAQDRTREVRHG